jgi:small subunit ribosomal protein S9
LNSQDSVQHSGNKTTQEIFATGRRKDAVARVRLYPGTGKIRINKRTLEEYFSSETLRINLKEPLNLTKTADKFDCEVTVKGGGLSGQSDAVRHGIARALALLDANLIHVLKKGKFLTRDSRMKERKKYGQKGARKRFQWTKR